MDEKTVSDRILKISYVCGDNSGPAYHDIFLPIKWFEATKLLKCHIQNNLETSALLNSDIVVFQRQYSPESVLLMRQLKAKGITCVFLCDDNMWEIPPTNPAKSTYTGLNFNRYIENLKNANGAVTSTPYLRSHVMRYNPVCIIHRNLVEVDWINGLLPTGRDNPNEVRLGWHGTAHHLGDVQHLKPVFRTLLQKYPQLKLVFMGFEPPYINEICPPNRKEFYNFVNVDAFYPCLANLDFDVAIAPLEPNGFNYGKTGRKAQEFAALKIPMVLQDLVTYQDWVHKDTCLKARWDHIGDWSEHLSFFIEHPEARKEYGERAFAQVRKNHDMPLWIAERAEDYKTIWRLSHGIKLAASGGGEKPITDIQKHNSLSAV